MPRQWKHCGMGVQVREVPCSGKIDGQYLMHAFEGGAPGVCVVACPKGECMLAQGNHRAEVRVNTVKNLLGEVGLNPEVLKITYYSSTRSTVPLKQFVDNAIEQITEEAKRDTRTGQVEAPSRTLYEAKTGT